MQVPPLVTRPKAATVGVGRQVILRPAVQKRYVELAEPTLSDQRSDSQRLWDALDDLVLRADLHVMRRLPRVLRAADFKITAVIVDDVLIDVEPGDTTGRRFGIAYDLGTTTVVATLLDLSTGTPVAVGSMLNPQQPFGADVITRISTTMMDPDALDRLAALARQGLHQLATEVCADGGVELTEVYEVALAGNATMTHIVLGIDPEPLGVAPFVMTARIFDAVLASDIGVGVHPGARAYLFPSLGAYVGGDIVAGALASGMDRDKRTRLFIDVGTNCEIVLSPDKGRPAAGHRGPGRPGLRGRRDPLRDAGRARRHRGRQDQRRGRVPAGDRRRRAGRAVRLRAGRRGRRAGAGQAAGRIRAAAGRRHRRADPARAGRAAAQGRRGAGVRAALGRPNGRPGT